MHVIWQSLTVVTKHFILHLYRNSCKETQCPSLATIERRPVLVLQFSRVRQIFCCFTMLNMMRCPSPSLFPPPFFFFCLTGYYIFLHWRKVTVMCIWHILQNVKKENRKKKTNTATISRMEKRCIYCRMLFHTCQKASIIYFHPTYTS